MLLGFYALGLFAVVLYFVQSDLPTVLGKGKPLEHGWPRAGDRARRALAGDLAGGRLADRARRDGLRPDGPRAPASRSAASATRCTRASAWPRRWSSPSRSPTSPPSATRRSTWPTSAPPAPARSRAGSSATSTSRSRSPCSSPRGARCARRSTTTSHDLAQESGQLKITHYDFDIDPLKAKEYGISSNGVVVFVRGTRHEQLGLPKEIESAKNALRTLDKEVQQRLMTDGQAAAHGRLHRRGTASATGRSRPTTPTSAPGVEDLRDVLVDQNYDVRYLGARRRPGAGGPQGHHRRDGHRPAEAVPARGVGGAQPLHRPRRAAAAGAGPREPRRHARGAQAPRPRVPRRDAGQRPGLRAPHPPGQRPHQPGDRHLHLAPVGDDAAAPRRARADHPAGRRLDQRQARPPRAASPSTRRSRRTTRPSSTRTATSRPTPARTAAPGRSQPTAVKKDARVFVLADSDSFDDEALPVAANQLLALDVSHWLMGDEAFTGLTSTEADVPDLAHPQAGRGLVLRHDLPRARRWSSRPAWASPARAQEAPARAASGRPRPGRPLVHAAAPRSNVMTGRAAAIQGGLAAFGPPAGPLHLAARAGARARLGDGHRRDEERRHPRPLRRRQEQRRLRRAAAATRSRPSGSTSSPRPSRRSRPSRAPRRSPPKPKTPPRPARAIWRAASRPPRCSTSSRRSSRRGRSACSTPAS